MANSEGPACQTCLEEVDLKLSRLSLRHSRKLKIVVAEQVCVCVKLCTEEFLTFCGWFQPTSFLTAFFHKLWIPLHLNSQQGAQGPLVSLVPMKTLTLGCENVPAWCTWMTYPICWGHSWWSYSYLLVLYGIRLTQEPACRHSVISWSLLIEPYWFLF